jgi:uncharacterized protein YgiM (DUF1202 family)
LLIVKQISKVSSLIFVLVMSVFLGQVAHAAVFEIQRVSSSDSLNLRSKPGARNAIVGVVPHNGKWIRTDGRRVRVGQTNWIKITWQGRTGWVNDYYIRQMQLNNTAPQPAAAAQPQATRPAPQAVPRPPVLNEATLKKKGSWVLECGDVSPFWRVIVYPGKALEVNLRGRNAGVLPMTFQKQDKNKWNTAMKTVVKSSNGHFATNMTIHYTKQCRHTLSKQNVRYRVKAQVNGEQMQGCCRAVQLN